MDNMAAVVVVAVLDQAKIVDVVTYEVRDDYNIESNKMVELVQFANEIVAHWWIAMGLDNKTSSQIEMVMAVEYKRDGWNMEHNLDLLAVR